MFCAQIFCHKIYWHLFNDSVLPAQGNRLRIEGGNCKCFGIENQNKQIFRRTYTTIGTEQNRKKVLYNYYYYKCNKNEKYLFNFGTKALMTLFV